MNLNVIEHVARSAKAYIALAGSACTAVLAAPQITMPNSTHVALEVAAIVATAITTFVVPNKATGVTIGEAVAMDGDALAQAALALKDVPLPGYAEKAADVAQSVGEAAQAVAPALVLPAPVVPVVAPVVAPEAPQGA